MKILYSELSSTAADIKAKILKDVDGFIKMLIWIDDWYAGGGSREQPAAPIIKPLIDMVPYVPFNQPVFRTFPLLEDGKPLAPVKVGSVIEVVTASWEVQSWTSSAKIAEKFYRYIEDCWGPGDHPDGTQQVVAQLLSAGHELASSKYFLKAFSTILLAFKNPKTDDEKKVASAVESSKDMIEDVKWQNEVIMLLPRKSKVRVVKLLTPRPDL